MKILIVSQEKRNHNPARAGRHTAGLEIRLDFHQSFLPA